MTKFHYIYLIWLLPLYFLLMGGYQLMVLRGIDYTYNTGESYVADVLEFDIKQIGAQTNGYLVLTFDMGSDGVIRERMSLPLQMAQSLKIGRASCRERGECGGVGEWVEREEAEWM